MSFWECFSFCSNPSKKPRLSFRGGGDSSEAQEVSAAAVEEVSAAAEQVVDAEVSAAAVQEQKKPVQYGLFRWSKPEADSGKPVLTPDSLKKPVGRPVREASQAATEMLKKVVEQLVKYFRRHQGLIQLVKRVGILNGNELAIVTLSEHMSQRRMVIL